MHALKGRSTIAAAIATAIVAMLLGAAAASARPAPDPPATPSVIGGQVAKIADYPWLAYIEAELSPRSGLIFSCTGAVIAPRVVLTAGHCVQDLETESGYSPSTYRVLTGASSRLHPPRDQISRVSRVLLFPGFRSTFIHGDAGLLILSRPVAAPALSLATTADSALLEPGAPLEVVGWGLTSPAKEDGPALLQAGSLTVQGPAACRRGNTELHRHFAANQQLCALDTPDFKTSGCYGDSGGPALGHRPDGSAVAIGIVSAGGSECEIREPNLFTRVDFVSQWASEWIAAVEFGAPEPAIPLLPPPLMGLPEAEFLALRALAESFTRAGRSHRLDFEESVHGECRRAGRSEFRCRVHWRRHADTYFGAISVFYAPHSESLLWSDRFTIHWISERCRRTAENPRSCQVSTRKLRNEKPKRLPEF